MARSNRQLTQFAVDRIKYHIAKGPVPGTSAAGNTEVEVRRSSCCDRPDQILVKLFNKLIMKIYLSPVNNRTPVGIVLQTGDFYDSKGRPSRTTRERLNGILDSLGAFNVIPEGTRVFIGEDGTCHIGKGEVSQVFNLEKPAVSLSAHPTEIIFN